MTTMTTRSHTYPTARAQAASRARRARARGAVMVEALIVISLLILGFVGLAFFREYYVKSLVASRLARGSILVYSMTGCGNDNVPAQWIGRPDLANLTAATPETASQPAADTQQTDARATASGKGGEVMSRIPGLNGDGSGVMNPMTNSDLTGRIRARTSTGGLSTQRTVFENQVRARSFVSCGDPIRNGEWEDVLGYIGGVFL
jgi:hypothetical protein